MVQSPEWVKAFVSERIRAQGPSPEAELDGVMLMGTIGVSFHLRADGSVWVYEWEIDAADPDAFKWRQATPQEAAGAIKHGAQRIPELLPLVPEKRSAAQCPICGGSGHFTRGEHSIKEMWCEKCCCSGYARVRLSAAP